MMGFTVVSTQNQHNGLRVIKDSVGEQRLHDGGDDDVERHGKQHRHAAEEEPAENTLPLGQPVIRQVYQESKNDHVHKVAADDGSSGTLKAEDG